MVNITFKNKTPEDYGAWLANKPVITHSEIKRTSWDVPMHDGLVYNRSEYRGDAYIELLLHMKNSTWLQSMREVRRWLSGSGQLSFSDTPDSYYEVIGVNLTEETRLDDNYGRLRAQMIIIPYEFLNSGDTALTSPASIENAYDECMPIYLIEGTSGASGTFSLSRTGTAGSITFTMPSSGKLYVDTRRLIATSNGSDSADAQVSGDYTKLRLRNGTYTTNLTSGFTLKVTPKWGYKV